MSSVVRVKPCDCEVKVTVAPETAGMAWAPESVYDPVSGDFRTKACADDASTSARNASSFKAGSITA